MTQENGVKGYIVSLPTVCGLREFAKVWTKQSDSVSMHMCSNAIPALAEEPGGSSCLYVVPVAEDVHTQTLGKVGKVTVTIVTINTVMIGHSVGLRQCYLHEVFLIFYAVC